MSENRALLQKFFCNTRICIEYYARILRLAEAWTLILTLMLDCYLILLRG